MLRRGGSVRRWCFLGGRVAHRGWGGAGRLRRGVRRRRVVFRRRRDVRGLGGGRSWGGMRCFVCAAVVVVVAVVAAGEFVG